MMEIRIGDRFEYCRNGDICEITSVRDSESWNLIVVSSSRRTWEHAYSLQNKKLYRFLGNFSKVDKFTELYNLLNS